MIKTIVALFALYESSLGNRLILQAMPAIPEPMPAVPAVPAVPAQPVTPAVPPEPVPPAVVPPAAPQPPAVIPEPIPPVAVPPPQPPVVVPPAAPQPPARPLYPWEQPPQPIGPPVGSVPINPVPPTIGVPPVAPPVSPAVPSPPIGVPPVAPPVTPGFPWQQAGFLQTKLECKTTPPNPASCAGLAKTITNPSENYEVLCSVRGACYGSTINIELTPMGYPIDRLKLFSFVGEYAAMNAVINIRNTRGDQVRVDEIKCNKPGACQNMQINMDPGIYIEQGDFYCTFGACDGCTINGTPCYYFVDII